MKCLLLILLIQMGLIAVAQTEIGVNAGMNQSGFYQFTSRERSSSEDLTSRFYIGYTASVTYHEQISEKGFAGFELENTQVRSSLYFGNVISHMAYNYYDVFLDLNYVNLHVLFGRKVPVKKAELFFEGSPFFGFLVHSKVVGEVHHSMSTEKINNNGRDLLRGANAGLRLKLGAIIPINEKISLSLDAKCNLGVFNVIQESDFMGITGYGATAGIIWKFEKSFLQMSRSKSS